MLRNVIVLTCALLATALANVTEAAPAPSFAPRLEMLQGANNWPGAGFHTFGLGWGRGDFSWGEIEPKRGEFHWERFDKLVLDAHAARMQLLPMLGYTAGWANAKHDGFAPPDDPADWQRFVRQVVAHYTRPPFNLRYFQVWNEPTRKAGFWHGKSEDEWIDTIYIPAARIIREYGGLVVFGGWPCCEPERLDHFLSYHNAWQLTDIVDVHYFEMRSWDAIFDKWIRTGKCRGIWQTEIGYLEFPNYYPNVYLRTLYWALRRGWTFADQYKLFWFAYWGAGPDAPRCLCGPGDFISEHGKRAQVMTRLLGDGTLQAFDGYTLDVPLRFSLNEEAPSAMGFTVRDQSGATRRTVIALCLDPAIQAAHPTLNLTLTEPVGNRGVRLVSATGEVAPLSLQGASRRTVAVPTSSLPALTARNYGRDIRFAIGYVVIE